jgi:hypothetical protein
VSIFASDQQQLYFRDPYLERCEKFRLLVFRLGSSATSATRDRDVLSDHDVSSIDSFA